MLNRCQQRPSLLSLLFNCLSEPALFRISRLEKGRHGDALHFREVVGLCEIQKGPIATAIVLKRFHRIVHDVLKYPNIYLFEIFFNSTHVADWISDAPCKGDGPHFFLPASTLFILFAAASATSAAAIKLVNSAQVKPSIQMMMSVLS